MWNSRLYRSSAGYTHSAGGFTVYLATREEPWILSRSRFFDEPLCRTTVYGRSSSLPYTFYFQEWCILSPGMVAQRVVK